ncbi:hypothetical protein CTZ27_10605 [Streptomyces griseocarneus]|nr:hypothetical protein CTZ27_10605 [Streptomyces griseocarneus]
MSPRPATTVFLALLTLFTAVPAAAAGTTPAAPRTYTCDRVVPRSPGAAGEGNCAAPLEAPFLGVVRGAFVLVSRQGGSYACGVAGDDVHGFADLPDRVTGDSCRRRG